jgi:hypothetical protein
LLALANRIAEHLGLHSDCSDANHMQELASSLHFDGSWDGDVWPPIDQSVLNLSLSVSSAKYILVDLNVN